MSGKRVAIVQSSYIPWKGYFDLINLVDEFILFDDVQYTRRDWRNRNRIKTGAGTRWLTIPVAVHGRFHQRVDETEISDRAWADQHWAILQQSYGRAPFFAERREWLEELYRGSHDRRLSDINRRFIEAICRVLGIATKLTWSTDYRAEGRKTERLLSLCAQSGATEYLSGPSAKAYLEEERFAQNGVTLIYMDYSGYPEYPQVHPPFDHHVTALDLILNVGADAPRAMKSFEAPHA